MSQTNSLFPSLSKHKTQLQISLLILLTRKWIACRSCRLHSTVEPRFNEPQFNKSLDITNGILCPSNSKIYEKEPGYNEPSIKRTNLAGPNRLVKLRFHCIWDKLKSSGQERSLDFSPNSNMAQRAPNFAWQFVYRSAIMPRTYFPWFLLRFPEI